MSDKLDRSTSHILYLIPGRVLQVNLRRRQGKRSRIFKSTNRPSSTLLGNLPRHSLPTTTPRTQLVPGTWERNFCESLKNGLYDGPHFCNYVDTHELALFLHIDSCSLKPRFEGLMQRFYPKWRCVLFVSHKEGTYAYMASTRCYFQLKMPCKGNMSFPCVRSQYDLNVFTDCKIHVYRNGCVQKQGA